MVDKYQDTNIARFELVQLLAGKYRNICVIGDDDQSIFDAPPALAVGSVKAVFWTPDHMVFTGVYHIAIAFIFHTEHYTTQRKLIQALSVPLRGNKVWLISPCLKAGALRHIW